MQIAHKQSTKLPKYVVREMRTIDGQMYQHMPLFGWRKCVPGGHVNPWTWRKVTPKMAVACEDAWNGASQ